MNTNLDLQKLLKKRIAEILEDYSSVNSNSELKNIPVYEQEIPVCRDKKDKELYPHIVVYYSEEEHPNEGENITAKLYITIGIYDDNPNNQGHKEVLEIANKIYQSLAHYPYLYKLYKFEYPRKIKMDPESIWPYFRGQLETNWSIQSMEQRGDDFI